MIVVLAVAIALLLGGAGAATAACTYSMTNVAEVAPGSTNTVGSLVITMDAATARQQRRQLRGLQPAGPASRDLA